jgi:LmbE family N-acetylglucosaminyl deacetylase
MNVLVVAAHPDDEVLGCGATIARHVRAGDTVYVLIVAEGATSRDAQRDAAARAGEIARLRAAAEVAARTLGVASVSYGGLPDNRLDTVPLLDVVKLIESHIQAQRPAVIYTHQAGDLNVDHGIVHRAVTTACRPLPGNAIERLCFFEVPSSTEWAIGGAPFAPNYFVEVTDTLALKLKALQAYAGELRPWPHPRSLAAVEHLARWRGASAGLEAAEAFMLGREIRRDRR